MTRLGPNAERQLDKLIAHYEWIDRPEATVNLIRAMRRAVERIDRSPDAGLPAPRPYPELAALGFRWIMQGTYWFAYRHEQGESVIVGVFHASADIPNRA